MKYNTASQEFHVIAFNSSGRVSGDAANITCTLAIDGGTRSATNDVNPTEIGTTGEYVFILTQAETLGHQLSFAPVSATSGVNVLGTPGNVIYTTLEASIKAKTDLISNTSLVSPRRNNRNDIQFFIGETHLAEIPTEDYSAKTLRIIFENSAGVDVAVIEDADITATSTAVAFNIPAGVTASQGRLEWSLRDVSGNEVLIRGIATIAKAAGKDA